MTRTDVHRPSAIIPSEYEFVAYGYMKEDAENPLNSIARNKAKLDNHMNTTGGHFSDHDHGGVCDICGAHCIYTAIFYHEKTNVYIETGLDCAENMFSHNGDIFRRIIAAEREAVAGKKRAITTLVEAIGEEKAKKAFEIFNDPSVPVNPRGRPYYEEATIGDIISKLVRYGKASDKALNFVSDLLDKIDVRDEREAAEKAAYEAAEDIPEDTGRMKIEGEFISSRTDESPFGYVTKMLVCDNRGFKVWGTMPSALIGKLNRGDGIEFFAKVIRSDDDPKFGFFNRPTKAKMKA